MDRLVSTLWRHSTRDIPRQRLCLKLTSLRERLVKPALKLAEVAEKPERTCIKHGVPVCFSALMLLCRSSQTSCAEKDTQRG